MRVRFKFAVMSAMLVFMVPVHAAYTHDNYVYFTNAGSSFNFRLLDYSITEGQPWDGVTAGVSSDGAGYIKVVAGRHGSDEVADWFKARAKYAIGERETPPVGWPDSLNFAIHGYIEIGSGSRMTACEVVIGQGHQWLGYNNWWIGGETMRYRPGYWESDTYQLGQYWLDCGESGDEYDGGLLFLTPRTDESNYFSIQIRTCPPSDESSAPLKIEVSLSPDKLWPPDRKMHDIEADVNVISGCDANPSIFLDSAESNEPDEDANDIQEVDFGTDDRDFKLRAAGSNSGDDRVYRISYTAITECGDETRATATVTVPHDQAHDRGQEKGNKKR